MQACVMRMFLRKKTFDRVHKTILETRTLEIGEVQLMVFKEGDNPP